MPKFRGIVTRSMQYSLVVEAEDEMEADRIATNMDIDELLAKATLQWDVTEVFPDELPEEI